MNILHKTLLRRFGTQPRRGGAKRTSSRILPEPLEDRRLLAILTFAADPVPEVEVAPAAAFPEDSAKLPPTTPDFNSDGLVDGHDIDALTREIVACTHRRHFDLTNDEIVDLDDRDAWLALAGAINLPSGNAYLLGDATLDGKVDVSDWNVLNCHMFTKVDGYCYGDFNADKVVDVSDLNILNEHMFTRSDLPDRKVFTPIASSVVTEMAEREEGTRATLHRYSPATVGSLSAIPELRRVDAVYAEFE